MAPAGHRHGHVAANLLAELTSFVRDRRLGATYAAETGFLLRRHPDTVRAADASFVAQERLDTLDMSDEGFFPGAPDLAVEVVSPSETYTSVEEKVTEWLHAGAQVVVVIDPRRRTARLHRPTGEIEVTGADDELTIPDLLPGWTMPMTRLLGDR
jgi:Uma2 family endonuclease